MVKSLEKYPYIKDGKYAGLWSAYNVVIIFDNKNRSAKIKLDGGVRGVNIDCDVVVDKEGTVFIS
jgi:hypothetical protein